MTIKNEYPAELFDAFRPVEKIQVSGQNSSFLINALRSMKRIRAAERCLANYRSSGDIGGPVHLSIGQEAVAVGVSTNLSKNDMVFGAHRSHAHLLALGSDLRRFFAEILGKDTGLSKGMGGSMHLWDQSVGFSGSVPIVAGTVSLAAGAALSFKLKNAKNVAVALSW